MSAFSLHTKYPIPRAFLCDHYELPAGNAQYIRSFRNSCMSDYTWSERTLDTLWDFF